MLLLNKNQTNNAVITIESIDTYPLLVFWFEQYQSKNVVTIGATVSDALINNERYQEFELGSTSCSSFTDGYYDYIIYGSTGTYSSLLFDNNGLILTTTLEQLEIGKAYIMPTGATNSTYGPTGDTTYVYEN